MKKRLFLSAASFALLFLFPKNINAQCENTAITILNPNKVRAAIPAGGDLFYDRQHDAPSLSFAVPYIPGESEINSIRLVGLWLGGYNEDGILGASCQLYGNQYGSSDYWAGSIDDTTGEVFENGCGNFDQVWKVSREDIFSLIDDFEDNGNIDQPIPQNILRWPGKGNPHFESQMGFVLPDQDMAPFFARNNNGIYEPLNGEYPIIDESWPNVIPNEMAWCVFNDIAEPTQNTTHGNPVGVEVHQLVYGFNCGDNADISHTVFTRHRIINKSGGAINDFAAGFFVSPQMGCFVDNYMGCDTILNTGYVYNNDTIDGHDVYCPTVETYGENPPVQAITFLNRSLDYFTYFRNSAVCVPDPAQDRPRDDIEHYNFLTGRWGDGEPFRYGQSGYSAGGAAPIVRHAFFDNPNDPDGWSMQTYPIGCRPKIVMSSSQYLFLPSDVYVLDMAYSFHRHPDSAHLGNVNVALENIPAIQSFYENGFENGCAQIASHTHEHIFENMELEISPNPNNGQFSIFSKNNFQNISLSIFDINGQKVWNGNMPAGQNNIQINMGENLRSGIYVLKAVREDGNFSGWNFLINKQ